MIDIAKYENQESPCKKRLPVLLLLDISKSMEGSKIEALNRAVQVMINEFAKQRRLESEIIIAVVTFMSTAQLHMPFTPAVDVKWDKLIAGGSTSMGEALKIAKKMMEKGGDLPENIFCPCVILVSDGEPNDNWETPMDVFVNEDRSSKCQRISVSIEAGEEGDAVLRRFIGGDTENIEANFFDASDASSIIECLKTISLVVSARFNSQNPNIIPKHNKADRTAAKPTSSKRII